MARRTDLVPEDKKDSGLPRGTFSYSQYGAYQRCPKSYEYSYVDNIKTPPAALAFKGQVIHRGAEEAHLSIIRTNKIPEIEVIKAVVVDAFDKGKGEVETWEEGEDAGKTKDSAIRLYMTYHLKALPQVHPVAAEQSFVLYLDGTPITGYIDLIDRESAGTFAGIEDPGVPVVADLKVSKASWSQADIDKDAQFTLYSKATGISKVRVDNLVTLKNGPEYKRQTAIRNPRDYEILLEHMAETITLIKKGIFPKTAIDSWVCSGRWCGYWDKCRGKGLKK
jgi:hypothetical protein